MIPKECKRLAEVDFPIAEVSKQAVREKKWPKEGHPSRLHQWWARRPLASSRTILMALLLPDPCDPLCPQKFKDEARHTLLKMHGRRIGWARIINSDTGLRRVILEFVADFANWNNSTEQTYLKVSRSLVKAAHGDESPLVVDPFSGGGSIPLEALRLGCDAFASDLNPVACLILKVMLEDIPRHAAELSEELRKTGEEIKSAAERNLSDLYPADSDGGIPIAYLWARTVLCESPKCGAEIPLIRSFWLSKKAKRKRALQYYTERSSNSTPRVEFVVFEPESDRDVPAATVVRAKATCLCCNAVLSPERVRAQLTDQKGGAEVVFDDGGRRIGGARIIAVVILRPDKKGRFYRLPMDEDYVAVREAQERVAGILDDWERSGKQGFCPVPDEPLPPVGTLGFRVQRYGMLQWGDLFTARQKVALVEFGKCLNANSLSFESKQILIALFLGKMADGNNSLARWESGAENPVNLFSRQAIPLVWDFCESTPRSNARGVFLSSLNSACKVIENLRVGASAQVQQADAMNHPLPNQSAGVWFTDPPYYDAVPYSDLSDFFLVWLKRNLSMDHLLQDPFNTDNRLSPKMYEIVQDETKRSDGQPKDRHWFEESMSRAFAEGRRIIQEDGVGSVVFAHKTTEGWEALLSGMIRGGWAITSSWPIATESPVRQRAQESAALATSIHLICRPRSKDAMVGDWADVLSELPERVRSWMEYLQGEGIRGADLVFACIGPALEIFSRFRAVETAEGHEIPLAEYLKKVWEVVGRTALEQILGMAGSHSGDSLTGALEEDARLTALFLWTLQSTKASNDNGEEEKAEIHGKTKAKGFSLPFDVVRRFAQPMGIDLDTWSGRIISQQKGIVRLLPVTERIKDLFGEEGADSAAGWIQIDSQGDIQGELFAEQEIKVTSKKSRKRKRIIGEDMEFEDNNTTVLDRVHAAMLFQVTGHASALRSLIEAECSRGPEFLRLSNALSALYPRGSQEKRLLDAMLLAVPR